MLYKLIIQQLFGINGITKLFQFKTKEDFQNLGNLFVQSIRMWLHETEVGESTSVQEIRMVLRAVGTIAIIFILPAVSYMESFRDKRDEDGSAETKILINRFALISFLEILMIFLLSKAYTAGHQVRYFTNPFFLMACIGINWAYEKTIRGSAAIRYTVVIITAVTIVINATGMYMTQGSFENKFEQFTEMGKFLEDHDLTFGYSSFWNASVNRMITNDRVKILNLHLNGRAIEVQGLYTCRKWYSSDYHKGKTFLILTDTEYQNEYWYDFAMNICGEPVDVLGYEGKHIFVYDYNIGEVLPPIQPYVY